MTFALGVGVMGAAFVITGIGACVEWWQRKQDAQPHRRFEALVDRMEAFSEELQARRERNQLTGAKLMFELDAIRYELEKLGVFVSGAEEVYKVVSYARRGDLTGARRAFPSRRNRGVIGLGLNRRSGSP
ncbi:MAG: hypothetical protein OXN92_01895 [Gammaproteobacteria bacterium]|nr:hypothetical protein [Gammaproteobacteria bacterium]